MGRLLPFSVSRVKKGTRRGEEPVAQDRPLSGEGGLCTAPASRPFALTPGSRLPAPVSGFTAPLCQDHAPRMHPAGQPCPVAASHRATRSPRRAPQCSLCSPGGTEILCDLGRNTQKNEGRAESPVDPSIFTGFFRKTAFH